MTDIGTLLAIAGAAAASGAGVIKALDLYDQRQTAKRKAKQADEAAAHEAAANARVLEAQADVSLATFMRDEIERIQREAKEDQLRLQQELDSVRELVDVLEGRLNMMTIDRDLWRGRALDLGWKPEDK